MTKIYLRMGVNTWYDPYIALEKIVQGVLSTRITGELHRKGKVVVGNLTLARESSLEKSAEDYVLSVEGENEAKDSLRKIFEREGFQNFDLK